MLHKHVSQVPEEVVTAGRATVKQVVIGADEAPHFAMRKFTIRPGGGMPPHTNTVEHEQYVLRGQAHIGLGDRVIDVQAGDALYIPAGMPHWYEVHGTEPFEFLCLIPNLPDKMDLVKPAAAS
ncbi:MAG: cupin domain-containing protein [Lentisphaerae bacterium]|nr:cupin domain-containing protein [Lentisphaerota bacterium]